MAKLSSVLKNESRKKEAARQYQKRQALKEVISSISATPDEKHDAMLKLDGLKRKGSKIRVRNRCVLTGRPRAVYKKFGLCRNAFRDLALKGDLPGVRKSSW